MKTSQDRRRRLVTSGTAAVTAVMVLSACSGQGEPTATPQPPSIAADEAAIALLPAELQEGGTLRVAIPTNEPPTQYYVEGTQEMTGVNPGIARLVADSLGLELQIEVTTFDAIIPGISADRYDMTVSSMTPTEERMEQLDFVEYVQMGSALGVPAGNPQSVDFDSLCGKKVAFLKGSYQLAVTAPGYNEACTAEGKPQFEILQFQDTQQAISALISARADVIYADSPILGFAAKQESRIEISAENDVAPVAVGLPKDSGTLEAVTAALAGIIASPEYTDLLAEYGLESMAISDARVNEPQG